MFSKLLARLPRFNYPFVFTAVIHAGLRSTDKYRAKVAALREEIVGEVTAADNRAQSLRTFATELTAQARGENLYARCLEELSDALADAS